MSAPPDAVMPERPVIAKYHVAFPPPMLRPFNTTVGIELNAFDVGVTRIRQVEIFYLRSVGCSRLGLGTTTLVNARLTELCPPRRFALACPAVYRGAGIRVLLFKFGVFAALSAT